VLKQLVKHRKYCRRVHLVPSSPIFDTVTSHKRNIARSQAISIASEKVDVATLLPSLELGDDVEAPVLSRTADEDGVLCPGSGRFSLTVPSLPCANLIGRSG
jgi:hypothetical protein